jgi:mannose-6-phosphate isomerase-like protein (cupin superfamily)
MIQRIRRVVTGHDAQGRSVILFDGPATSVKEMAPTFPGLALTDFWETTASPASNAGSADAAERPVHLEPGRNGTLFRMVEFPPDSARPTDADARKGFEAIGAGHVQAAGHADPMMHKTATVDYAVVVKGEIYAVMEKGEALLKAGDVLVQRGTNHSWSVRGKEPALVAFILVGAEPLK